MLSVYFFTACSSHIEEEMPASAPITLDADAVRFTINETPFGAEDELPTRHAAPIVAQKIDLGEGVEAELNIEHDAAPVQTRAAKPMSDGNYTIVAYRDGIRMAQRITFTISSGVMTVTSAQSRYSWVTPGKTYTFVCHNDKVTDNNDGTFTIPLANAATALIDKQSITIGSTDQAVSFNMKRSAVRVHTKLMTLTDAAPSLNINLGYQANTVPASCIFDMATGTFTTDTQKNTQATSVAQSYTPTSSIADIFLDDDLPTATATSYLYILADTKPEDLVYQIAGGSIYNKTITAIPARKMKATGAFAANGSYTLTLRLMPKYKYLFENGTTGYLGDADKRNHTPIAVVVANGKAIALWNANGGNITQWDTETHNANAKRNSTNFTTVAAALNSPIQGKTWTWEKNYNTKAKTEFPKFAAYRYAGYFYQSNDLKNKIPTGQTLKSTLNTTGVWYLPSCVEWKEAFVNLGFAQSSAFTGVMWTDWKGSWVNYAFRIANGTSISNKVYTHYWTSSEYLLEDACMVATNRTRVSIGNAHKYYNYPKIRPFVSF